MRDCDHAGHRRYTRRVFANGTVHYCVQCIKCLRVVKLDEHQNRPFIRFNEIPLGKTIFQFIDAGDDE